MATVAIAQAGSRAWIAERSPMGDSVDERPRPQSARPVGLLNWLGGRAKASAEIPFGLTGRQPRLQNVGLVASGS
jgi:hypothetical protein